jgi:hypothetical protein
MGDVIRHLSEGRTPTSGCGDAARGVSGDNVDYAAPFRE